MNAYGSYEFNFGQLDVNDPAWTTVLNFKNARLKKSNNDVEFDDL